MVSCCTLKKTQTLPKAELHWPLPTTDLVTSPSNSCSPSTITAAPFSSQDTPGSSLHEDSIPLLLSVPSTKSILPRTSLCGFLSLPCQLNCNLLKGTLVFQSKVSLSIILFYFLHSTYGYLFTSLLLSPALEYYAPYEQKPTPSNSKFNPQYLEYCLAKSRYSMSICWMNE